MDEDDVSYYSGEFLQDILEVTLLELGGPKLLADAHHEASAYVDERYPWNGQGDEPAKRVSAYCAVLWQRAEQARTESGSGASPSSRFHRYDRIPASANVSELIDEIDRDPTCIFWG